MKKHNISRVRAYVAALIFFLFGVGIALHVGWGTLSSMGIGAIAYICPLGALETFFATWTGVPRVFFTLLVTVVAVLLLGKVFCSWVCPVPVLQKLFVPKKKGAAIADAEVSEGSEDVAIGIANEGANSDEQLISECATCTMSEQALPADIEEAQSKTLALKRSLCGGKRDGIVVDSRHAVLVGALLSSAIFGFPVFCLICPIGLTFATFVVLWGVFGYAKVSWSLVVFPLILVLELFVFKKWCHKICPLSALLSLLSIGNKTIVPKVNEATCLHAQGIACDACKNVCPEQVNPHSKKIPECTKCGECAGVCPTASISFPFFQKHVAELEKESTE